jgi:ATP-dependent Clp protease adapter protein ClpS
MTQHRADRPPGSPGPDPRGRSPEHRPALQLPRYKLILHSSAVKDLMFVVRTIMELTRLCLAEATHKMWEAHHFGRSLILVTHKERAELYVEQFACKGLTVTMEMA